MLVDYFSFNLDPNDGSEFRPKGSPSDSNGTGSKDIDSQKQSSQEANQISAGLQAPHSELDDLLDKMLEIQTHNIPGYSSQQQADNTQQSSSHVMTSRESANLIESVIEEDRTWSSNVAESSQSSTLTTGQQGLLLAGGYYFSPQIGFYATTNMGRQESSTLPFYQAQQQSSGQGADSYLPESHFFNQHHYLYNTQRFGYGQQASVDMATAKNHPRHPFERAVSNPEFYLPMHFFGDSRDEVAKKLALQSHSMPTFDASINKSSEFDQQTTSDVTSSPEPISPAGLSPPFGEKGSSSFLFSTFSSAAGPSGQGRIGKISPPASQLCAVCGDVAQCLHYGVRSCEGCKGFFKRSVQKNSKYVCLGNKDCIIDKRRRNRCQFCRFQKCLTVGMVKEVVRTDSLKGRRGRLPSKSKSCDESTGSSGHVKQPLITSLVNAFVQGGEDDRWQSAQSGSSTMTKPDRLVDSICAGINAVKQWANHLPGWAELFEEDKNNLLVASTGMIESLRIAYLSINIVDERRLIFDDYCSYKVDSCDKLWLPWLNSLLELAAQLKNILGDDIIGFSCLMALLLFKNENVVIKNVESCDRIKNNFLNCLKEHCTFSEEAKSKTPLYFSSILAFQNQIQSSARKLSETVITLHNNGTGQLPPILFEMVSNV